MERVRKLFSRRELLRLGRAQRLWTNHAVDPRWHRKFCIQNARSLSTLNEACARKACDRRRVRLRSAKSPRRRREVDPKRTGRSSFKSLAGDCWILLVERRLAKRRSQETRHRYDRSAQR